MTYRVRNIVLAVALAALAAMLTSLYVSSYRKSVQADEASVTVWVAAKEIAAGTTGSEALERGMLRSEDVARRTVVPGAITRPGQIEDLVATEATYEGEQVSVRRFQAAEEAGLRGELRGNLRAMQIAGDANQLLAGTLQKGDHVDVVGNFRFQADEEAGGEAGATRVVLRDLLVLRAPNETLTSEKVGGDLGATSVQLAVTDQQAQKLFFVMKNGDWHLQLRPVVEAADSPESFETLNSVLCDGMTDKPAFCLGGN